MSRVAATPVAAAMELSGFESAYFLAMVDFALAKDDETKNRVYEEMRSLAKARKVRVLGEDEFDFYKSWRNSVIRELVPVMPDARPFDIARACRPRISATEVCDTIDFLTKLGLLEKDQNGNYHQTDKSISMAGLDTVPVAARQLQREMGAFVIDAISLPLSERDFSGITMGITRKGYQRLVKAIAEFRNQVVDIVSEDGETEQVYRLNLQLFPLTERVQGGK